jgi:hypothetical protein
MSHCRWRHAALLITVTIAGGAPLAAQDGSALLRQGLDAYDQFDLDRALPLLRRGVNPAISPPDTLWARGVQVLISMIHDAGRTDEARAWIRWAVRRVPDLRLDTLNLVSDVIAAFRSARTETVPAGGDSLVATTWSWPGGDPGDGAGRLIVTTPGVTEPVTVVVVGRAAVPAGGLPLPAGSYQVLAEAPGYQPVRVTREVLPGVTTALAFSLLRPVVALQPDSVLPDEVRSAGLARAVRLSVRRFGSGAPACAAGFLATGDGLVVTTYRAIRGSAAVQADVPGRQPVLDQLRVVAYDIGADLAVLRVPGAAGDSLPVAQGPTAGQFVWALGYPDCGPGTSARSRLAAGTTPGELRLTDPVAFGAQGAALITQRGGVAGLSVGPSTAVPASALTRILATARQNLAEQVAFTPRDVAVRERHLYGSVAFEAVADAVAAITPLETWHWADLATSGPLPFTFTGPMGRYQAELTRPGQPLQRREFTVDPDTLLRLNLMPAVAQGPRAAETAPQRAVRRGGGFPWPIALLGGAGAAVAAVVLTGKGDSTGTDGGPGSIRVRIPFEP